MCTDDDHQQPKLYVSRYKDINVNKSAGPDKIPPRVLKENASQVAKPLYLIFRKSLDEGKLPEEWKLANITPIFKNKGSKHQSTNYRPVSLTCVACKLLEKIIRKHIIHHMKENKLFTEDQHGFMDGRSCSTNLLATLDKWTDIIDNKGSIDVIYMDFMKAFDSVPHRKRLHKVKSYGIDGKIYSWLRDFLMLRKQQVVVNGTPSDKEDVISGVPQGSVLGPILFVIYINDLIDRVKSDVKIFADDTKLFRRIDDTSDCILLQNDLTRLERWAEDWQMRFHPQKCEVLRIGKDHPPYDYTMKSTDKTYILNIVDEVKDLGVYVDSHLDFDRHCSEMVSKANRILGTVRRTFQHIDAVMMVQLYKSLIRPYLEYGVDVWSPSSKKNINMIESIQRRATKMIPEISNKSYSERLQILKLPSLVYRRNRGDMIQVYKYVNNIWDVHDDTFLKPTEETRTRGHKNKLYKDKWKTTIRGNFFSNRITNLWNSLPESVIDAESVQEFKVALDASWENKEWLYDFNG